ncbi:uncharacterized protein LOC113855523 [Abrus precatorius]|uniref:Uncharacterized protein LOC113855523 n=1 Tax=Abrus precatorius TaxID=3816 RepID=A0A8B8KGM1_ABRPR|nr:uncharacterized protein LOC113855523 [Abrus precatorius]
MLLDPLPDVIKVFNMVIQQERHLNMSSLSIDFVTDVKSLVVSSNHNSQSQGNTNGTFCDRGRSNNNNKGRGRSYGGRGQQDNKFCTYYERTNHTVDTCYFKHDFPLEYQSKFARMANFATSLSLDSRVSNDSNLQEVAPLVTGFTEEQYQCNRYDIWLIDNGATDHITFNLFSLVNSFQKFTKKMIGSAKEYHGLYMINAPTPKETQSLSVTTNTISTKDSDIWHLRLGHISDSVMKVVSRQLPFIPPCDIPSPYDICHFSK